MVAIFVAATFIVALVIDALVRRSRRVEPAKIYVPVVARRAPSYPSGYFFTPGHLWVNLKPSGKILVGMDELVSRLIGKTSTIQMLKRPGEKVSKGELLASLIQKDKVIRIPSPVDGIIEQSNFELEDNPAELVESPYTKGWFYAIKPTSLSEDLKNFTVADQIKNWWSRELDRLREFVQTHVPQPALAGLTIQDGGFPLDGLVEHFDQKAIEQLEINFLNYRK